MGPPIGPWPNWPLAGLYLRSERLHEHFDVPGRCYREAWWVFASKSWQFRPAMKDGKPVRFLKRIALTDLNLAEPQ